MEEKNTSEGLKADKTFAKGDIICQYSSEYWQFDTKIVPSREQIKYLSRENHGWYVGDPSKHSGALIRDAIGEKYVEELKRCSDIDKVDQWCKNYIRKYPFKKINASFLEPLGQGKGLYVAAIRKIAAGEEVFISFDAAYWVDLISLDSSVTPEVRLACLTYLFHVVDWPSLCWINSISHIYDMGKGEWRTWGSEQKTFGTNEMHAETEKTLKALGFTSVSQSSLNDWVKNCTLVKYKPGWQSNHDPKKLVVILEKKFC